MNIPQPKNRTEVERFIGLASYNRKFIPKFAKLTHNMNKLKKKFLDNEIADTTLTASVTNPDNHTQRNQLNFNRSTYIWIKYQKSQRLIKDYLKNKNNEKRILTSSQLTDAEINNIKALSNVIDYVLQFLRNTLPQPEILKLILRKVINLIIL